MILFLSVCGSTFQSTAVRRIAAVLPDASDAQLKSAYKKGALKHHPDKNADNIEAATKRFAEIQQAYEVRPTVTRTFIPSLLTRCIGSERRTGTSSLSSVLFFLTFCRNEHGTTAIAPLWYLSPTPMPSSTRSEEAHLLPALEIAVSLFGT